MWQGRGLVPGLLDTICSLAGCVATKDLPQVQEATVVVFHQCGRLLPVLGWENPGLLRSKLGKKELR